MPTLILRRDGEEQRIEVASRLAVGRSSANDVVVDDPEISSHHCVFWLEAAELWVRDLGSRNGTHLDDALLRASSLFPIDSTVRIGSVAITWRPSAADTNEDSSGLLEDSDTGVRVRLPVGGIGLDANGGIVETHSSDPSPATIHVEGDDPVLTLDGLRRTLQWGQAFTVGGRPFQVIRSTKAPAETVGVDAPRHELTVRLIPPHATLTDPSTGTTVEYFAEYRVAMLYVLGQNAGSWMEDDDVLVGVYGRQVLANAGQRLTALTYRLRRACREAGVADDWIQRRGRAMRLHLARVTLLDADGSPVEGD